MTYLPTENKPGLPENLVLTDLTAKSSCAGKALGAGDPCPYCGEGRLDYDGTLNLFCPACGEKINGGGAFT